MKRLPFAALAALALSASVCAAQAQTYVKLNGLYALAGIVNPAFEFRLSDHSTFQVEAVVSPWKSVRLAGKSRPMLFTIGMNEYRYYFREANRGWYVGGNAGMMAFNMSKPYWNGGIRWEDRYCKGYGFMVGAAVGYEYIFRERWILDAFVGWSWMHSRYNGYSFDHEIDMYPNRPVQPPHPDPLNDSGEWYPNKIGLSIGVRIFDPERARARRAARSK